MHAPVWMLWSLRFVAAVGFYAVGVRGVAERGEDYRRARAREVANQ